MTISKEAKVGVLAVVSGVILYFGFNFLKGSDLFSPANKYYAVYTNVDGLTVSNPVVLNGLSVGMVGEINLLQEQGNKLLVRLDIDNDVLLSDSSLAILADGGFLGGKVIKLSVGKGGSRVLENEDTMRVFIEQGITTVLREKTLPVLDNADTLMRRINQVVAKFDSTGYVLNHTLRNFELSSAALQGIMSDNRGSIKATMSNMSQLTNSLNDPQKGIRPLMGKFNTLADSLSQLELSAAVNNANRSIENLNKVLGRINDGQGTLGKLTKDDSLYNAITKASTDLDKLFIDLRKNPKRYVHISVFGPKEKKQEKK